MNTYLIVWNPTRYNWENLATEALQTSRGESIYDSWTCRSKAVRIGDRLFLIRLGEEPRGIIASGWAKSAAYEGKHWVERLASEGKTSRYVDCEFECLLDPAIDAPLGIKRLPVDSSPKMHWEAQSSGIVIHPDAAEKLELLWEQHTNKSVTNPDKHEPSSAIEGELCVSMVRHRRRENSLRNEKIVEAKHRMNGRLRCEVPRCGFDFESVYGETGRDYVQIHHLKPLADRTAPSLTLLADLAVVCANCHAMIHRGGKCRDLNGLIL